MIGQPIIAGNLNMIPLQEAPYFIANVNNFELSFTYFDDSGI